MYYLNTDKYDFISSLQRSYNCAPVGDIRVKTRCILCGDSKKDMNKKRLYIKCDPNDVSEPVTYMCFNCGEFGSLTADMLTQIVGEDYDFVQLLKRINRFAMNDSGTMRVNKYKNDKEIQVKIPPPKNTQSTVKKIKYLNKRIGYPIPIEDYEKLKLIFNISEFLEENGIPLLKKYKDYIHSYDRDYIGWLSVKNEYIILRDITGQNKMRYIKFNIFGMESNAHSFYTIRNGINTITTDPIKIIAAEGPLDILSIAYNVYGGIIPNCVFMSTNHGAFYNPLLFYINKGLVGSNVFVEIYRDSDSIMNYQLLKEQLKIYTKNYKVFRNSIGKDFGVPPKDFVIEEESF